MPLKRSNESARPFDERKQEALLLARSGRWEDALRKMDECLAEQAGDADLLRAKAPVLLALGRPGDAAEAALAAADIAGPALLRPVLEKAREELVAAMRQVRKGAQGGKKGAGKLDADTRARIRPLLALIERIDAAIEKAPQAPAPAPAPVKKRQTISLVMIAKNEETHLAGCLESVKEWVDEIVVVDTGSTDRTVEVAREYGARTGYFEWVDDFSAARNAALQLATCDWALWLDADERLQPGQGPLLRYLVDEAESNVGSYMTNICNYMQEGENPLLCWHRAARLFRRLNGVEFIGRVHEQFLRSLEAMGYVCAMSQLKIDHHGYTPEMMGERNKHERFIRMLHREVEENRDPAYFGFHLFNLGNAYYTAGNMESAAEWFAKAAEHVATHEDFTAMLYVEWATACHLLGRPDETDTVCQRADALGVRHPGLAFSRGYAALHRLEYGAAERWFRQTMEDAKDTVFVHLGDTGIYTYKARYGVALACMGQDRYQEAANECAIALAEKADFMDAAYLRANALLRLGRPSEAIPLLEGVLAVAPDHAPSVGDMGAACYEQGDFARALPHLRRSAQAAPSDLRLWLKLANCCEQLGQMAEARDAYLAVRQMAPGSASICVNLGRAYAALGEDAQAIDCFADAIHLDPNDANAYFNAGDVLYRLGYYPKAAEAICAGLSRDPANVEGFFVLGNCYFQTEDFAAANAAYEQVLARRPDHKQAQSNQELARERLNDGSAAA